MLTVVAWLWRTSNGPQFGVEYVNRLRNMLERNLDIPHELVLLTRDPVDVDPRIRVVKPPHPLPGAIRCRRRMWQFAAERKHDLGERILAIDLDVVIVDNITSLVDRREPVVCWNVGYAGVYSGSFLLFDAGALDGAWQAYRDSPIGFPQSCGEVNASDQAMLNRYLAGRNVAEWTERDGLRTWFGKGYEKLEHLGVGPNRTLLPHGTRVVVLGSKDKHVLDGATLPWIKEHWR